MDTKDRIQKLFAEKLRTNERIQNLQGRIEKGTATYKQAEKYAELVGRLYAEAFKEVVGTAEDVGSDFYFETVREVFPPGLQSIFTETAAYVEQVQRLQNEKAGVGLKPLLPDFKDIHTDYLEKLQETATDKGMEFAMSSESEFYAQKVVDAAVRMNAEAHANAGLEVRVTRIYDGIGVRNRTEPCEWCLSRAGENMTLSEAKAKDVFSRHPRCGCTVIYTSAKGETTMRVGGSGWVRADEYARRKG